MNLRMERDCSLSSMQRIVFFGRMLPHPQALVSGPKLRDRSVGAGKRISLRECTSYTLFKEIGSNLIPRFETKNLLPHVVRGLMRSESSNQVLKVSKGAKRSKKFRT